MTDAPTQPDAPVEPQREERELAVFVLRYDDEVTYLVNEGLVRPGTQPSGLK